MTTPSPPSQNADDRILFLNGMLPIMNQFLCGLPWMLQPDRCVLFSDHARIHSAKANAFIGSNDIFPLRLPPYSPEFRTIKEVFSEYAHHLKSAHHSYPGSPEALLHAVALTKLTVPNIGTHFDHSF